jgi:hypothetical protein
VDDRTDAADVGEDIGGDAPALVSFFLFTSATTLRTAVSTAFTTSAAAAASSSRSRSVCCWQT